MRIAVVSEDPAISGGIPRYTVPVARELARRGHAVLYLAPGGPAGYYDLTIRRHWLRRSAEGVEFATLANSRSVGVHTGDPLLDVSNDDTRYFAKELAAFNPDVVHVHSTFGLPVEILGSAAQIAPVALSVHEFGLICQRRVLVQRDQSVCGTFATGAECPQCVDPVDARRLRWKLRLDTPPGRPLRTVLEAAEKVTGIDIKVANEQSNDVLRGRLMSVTPSRPVDAEPWRRRLTDSVTLVNRHVSAVLPVSGYVADVLTQVGVDDLLISVCHIGSGSAERVPHTPLPLAAAPASGLRLLFLGGFVPNKGGLVLARALSLLEAPPVAVLRGRGNPDYERMVRAAAPSNAVFGGGYDGAELVRLIAEADVLVSPTVGPDTSPQVVFEALGGGRPVVGSDIGGIPDFIRDGVNGLLVPADDAEALAGAIQRLLDDPELVLSMAQRAHLPNTVADHVDELEAHYRRLRAEGVAQTLRATDS